MTCAKRSLAWVFEPVVLSNVRVSGSPRRRPRGTGPPSSATSCTVVGKWGVWVRVSSAPTMAAVRMTSPDSTGVTMGASPGAGPAGRPGM